MVHSPPPHLTDAAVDNFHVDAPVDNFDVHSPPPPVIVDMVVSPLVRLPTVPTSAAVRPPTAPPVTADMMVSPLVRPLTASISVAVHPPTAPISDAVHPPAAPISDAELAAAADEESGRVLHEFVPYKEDLPPAVDPPLPQMVHSPPPHLTDATVGSFHVDAPVNNFDVHSPPPPVIVDMVISPLVRLPTAPTSAVVHPPTAHPVIADMVVSSLVRPPTTPISVAVYPPTAPISAAERAAAADEESGRELPEFVAYTEDLPPAVDPLLPQMVPLVRPPTTPISVVVCPPTAPISAAERAAAADEESGQELPEFVAYTEDLPPAVDPLLPQMVRSPPLHLTDAAVDIFHVDAPVDNFDMHSPPPPVIVDMVVYPLVRLPTAPTSTSVRPPTAPPVTADMVVSPLVRPRTAHFSVAVRPPTAPIYAA
ncbi:hypothetical protein MLD38_002384 [Melastoma candidum]|uniref:Uncharacterized protein n=1 Tax=Melastoma candidum TaxID=119954 RepID=A0ACB9S2X0_9MYRT|nr:hypothetical protein MLD38_002384 [Melastoma candidum]